MTAMRTRISCCKGCERRHQGCHSTCEDYKRESAELEELRTMLRNNQDQNQKFSDYYWSNRKKRKPKRSTEKGK